MTVPCHCSVHTPFGYIPPHLSGCTPLNDNVTIYHAVSLAVLQSFFDEKHLCSLLGDTLLQQPLPVDLPAFRIFKTNASLQLAKDSLLSYDLNRAINITIAQGKVFHSLAETMRHDAISTDSDSISPTTFTFSADWILFTYYLNLLLAISALIGVLFLIYRVKILATTVAIMHLHRAVAHQPTLPLFISFFTPLSATNTLTAQSTKCTDATQTFPLSPYFLILCVILLAFLLFKNLRR